MKLATVFAAVLFAASSARAALAQGTGGRDDGTFSRRPAGLPARQLERHAPGPNLADIKEKPRQVSATNRPANVRFPNGQQCASVSGISLLPTLPRRNSASPPKVLEPGEQFGIAHGVLYRAVAEPVLDCLVSCPAFPAHSRAMPQHVDVNGKRSQRAANSF